MLFLNRTLTLFFIVLVLCCWGCGDTPNSVMELVLPDSNDATEPLGSGDLRLLPGDTPVGETAAHAEITSIPPHLKELWWGSWDDTLETFQEDFATADLAAEDSADEDVRTGIVAGVFNGVCLRAEQEHYYTKYIDVDGIAVIGTELVRDAYFLKARDEILIMTDAYPGIRKALAGETDFRMILVFDGFENPYHIPETRYMGHNFNLGTAWCTPDYCVATVNEVISPDGIPYAGLGYGTFHHEFAHAINTAFLRDPGLFPNFVERLVAAYDEGLQTPEFQSYPDDYWWVSASEFWAVATAKWLDDMGNFGAEPVPLFNVPELDALVPTPTEEWERKLASWRESFPKLAALLEDVYPIRPLGQMRKKYPTRQ